MAEDGWKRSGPTLASIAEKVGVSINTVSRALRVPQTVRPELRHAITCAMEELNYVPNRLAGGLSGQRSDLVSLVVPSLGGADFAVIADLLQARLSGHGLQVMLATTGEAAEDEIALVRNALSWRPAAVAIAARDRSPKVVEMLKTAAIPVVQLWDVGGDVPDCAVGLDHAAIGRAQAEHLIVRGFRRLAFLGSLHATDLPTRRRLEGATACGAAAGLAPLFAMTRPSADQPSLGTELLWQLLARQPDIDGIIAASDHIGFGVMAGLATLRRTAGKDIGIIGFGDDPASAYVTPGLSTIRPDRTRMAERAADLIVARIAGGAGRNEIIDWQLATRST